MAWRSSGSTNEELVKNLHSAQIIQSPEVLQAMLGVDRGLFVPKQGSPYQDSPQGIGYRATISAPHMHAHALETLKDQLKPGMKALDVGSGSGYLLACMALMVGDGGHVVGIEHIPELVEMSQKNLQNWNKEHLDKGTIKLVTGDGRLGYPEDAPYDAIHVGAAAAEFPKPLLEQLAVGGRLVIPEGPTGGYQVLVMYEKGTDGNVHRKELMGVTYVPLTSRKDQLR